MTATLPPGLEKYAETALFTETSVPAKLTSDHDTKPGVWGKLVVLEGALDYVIPGPPLKRQRIEQGGYGIIQPEEKHRVELIGPAVFKVEFHKRADQGAAG